MRELLQKIDRRAGGKVAACAFTLIELLVVIAIIAVLAALLLPSLGRAKQRAQGIYCMGNTRQVMIAWQLYAGDNNEWLAPNEDNCDFGGWIAGCMDYNGGNVANYTVKFLLDPRYAKLGPYTKAPGVYRCPADHSRVTFNGTTYDRVRSISMSQAVGTRLNALAPVAGPWLPGDSWRTYGKLTDITLPAPCQLWVVVDEHPDSINDGGLGVECSKTNAEARIVDYPASFHAGACGFAFADGHSEIHRWKDARTMPPVMYNNYLQLNIESPNNPDVTWIQERTSAPR